MRKALFFAMPLVAIALAAFRPAHEREFNLAWGNHNFSAKSTNAISAFELQELMLSKPISLFDGNEKLKFNAATLFIIPRSAEPVPINIGNDGSIALDEAKLNEINFEAIAPNAIFYVEVPVASYPDGSTCELPGISFKVEE